MTAPGHNHVQTPLAGLVETVLAAPEFTDLAGRAAGHPDDLAIVGPASARLFVACALTDRPDQGPPGGAPLLVVTATGREADDLTAELRSVYGDAVALFPSWETLPHERLSPGVDTVGARMLLLRRLARPGDTHLGPPLRVVVTTVRSLLQPMAAGLAEVEPVTLFVGAAPAATSLSTSTLPKESLTWTTGPLSIKSPVRSVASVREPPPLPRRSTTMPSTPLRLRSASRA